MTTLLIPGEDFSVPSAWPVGTWGMMTSIKVAVANLHWKADPKKRNDPLWFPTNTEGLSEREIKREFDLDWTIADGKPVFPDYDKNKHGTSEVLKAEPGLPLSIGLDFGLNPAGVFSQVSDMGQVRVLRVLNEENKAMPLFGPLIVRQMLELNAEAGYEAWTMERVQELFEKKWLRAALPGMSLAELQDLESDVWHATYEEVFAGGLEFDFMGDPAGKARNANDAKSAYQILWEQYGFRVKGNQKHQVWDTRRSAVTALLIAKDIADGVPKFVVSAHPSCERLRAGFEGSYAYAEAADNGGREMPLKDRFSHPQDALQYIACAQAPQGSGKVLGGAVTVDYSPNPRPAQRLPPAQPVDLESRWDGLELEEREEASSTPSAPVAPWNPFLQSQIYG
ncbi:MAG: hypothetical protein ACRYFS_24390 [Janthinobacterium lividum]